MGRRMGVTHSLCNIIDKYSQRDEKAYFGVGLRPSGIIHLGNMATLSLGGLAAYKLGPHISEMQVTVCDLDMPDQRDWNIRKEGYTKYFADLPDPRECHQNLLAHSLEGITDFAEGIESELGVKTNIRLLSEIQRAPEFRVALKRVLDDPSIMRYLFPRLGENQTLVFPICSDCHTASSVPSMYNGHTLVNACTNPSCETQAYEVDVMDTSKDIAVHYFIDPLRDRAITPKTDVHVFGGDYSSEHEGNARKVEKIMSVIAKANCGEVPDILMGPTFYARDGEKMSKRKENGLTRENLKEHFGKDYVKRVLDLADQISSKGVRVVDYTLVEEGLFGKKFS